MKTEMTEAENRKEETAEETKEEETRFSPEEFLKEGVSLLLMAYLFVLFAMYPFYMQHGYAEIGNAKFFFYRDVTVGAFCLIIPAAIFYRAARACREKKLFRRPSMSATDWTVLLYGVCVLASYLFSDFKNEALWGENGWHMGLATQLLFVATWFLISRFWEFDIKILYAGILASSVVFLLGLLNRYSIFPIAVEGANNGFLSTLGNINWYCGYLAVFLPAGALMYWSAEKLHVRLLGLAAVAVGMATGVSQGSNSAFLIFMGLGVFIFCLSFQSGERMKRFVELLIVFCLVCQAQRLYRMAVPGAFDFYEGSLSDRITLSPLTLYALVPLFFVYLFVIFGIKKRGGNFARYKMLRQILLLLLTITVGVYFFLLILNTRTEGGIRFMGEISSLRFNKLWGSSRGGTWAAGYDLFKHMPPARKLTGAGPDCFAMYLYTVPDIRERVMDQFGRSRLTNAHNEWLSVLVNNGILGLICYAGIFISAIFRFLRQAKKLCANGAAGEGTGWALYAFAAGALCYTVHNMVSFQQILSTPFIFCMLGMGERLLRERKCGRNG